MNDEFEDLSKYWDNEEIHKELFKEAKSWRGNMTYEIVSQHIDFEKSFYTLIDPIV